MKTTFTRTLPVALVLLVFASFQKVSATPEYSFVNPVLIAGTDKEVGAQYRFSNVYPGTDAIITITALSNVSIDDIDGGSGFTEAFQPRILVAKKKKGKASFNLSFYFANTSIPRTMLEVPMTAIDIDGYEFPDEKVYEFDEYELSPVYYVMYDMLGTSLDIKFSGGASGTVSAINKTAVDYPGVDTVQKNVMFSMVYAGVSSVNFSVGAENKSNSTALRLRSVYFQKFTFPGLVLPVSDLRAFDGSYNGRAANLQWELAANNTLNTVILERSSDGKNYSAISELYNSASTKYQYDDFGSSANRLYYRLKLKSSNGAIAYSNVIVLQTNAGTGNQNLAVYPTVVSNGVFNVNAVSNTGETASLKIYTMNGKLLQQQEVLLQRGGNSISVNIAGNHHGNHIVTLEAGGRLQTGRILFP